MSLAAALSRLAPQTIPFEPGHVWLAGAGPGHIGCLTLDVLAAIATADTIVYDALVDPAVLRAADGADLHFVGKRGGKPSASQAEINALLIRLARQGQRVLRLKGGDPNLFGRGGEEALELATAGIPFRFLPGITSAFGALAATGIPATLRGVNKAIILATGHAAGTAEDLDWAALAATGQPIVVYMGLAKLPVISAALIAGGADPSLPAAVIVAATTREERRITASLGEIALAAQAAGATSPALIVIGEIVAEGERLRALMTAARVPA
ncbi:uroporphyrinogen-III C-methyltransferase [Acetobacteraceae bacterium H6797]|nr:uroporphyrinogen-III C-methyltransferase [Acetobacteraceae bacterium H6797]